MAVLVTGGGGFVGLNLVEALLERGQEVILFDNSRVYAIYWVGLENAREADEPLFRHVMDTFTFPSDG